MLIESLDAVFYTCVFLLPGFIMSEIINALNTPKRKGDFIYFLTCLLYSIINLAACSFVYRIIFNFYDSDNLLYWVSLIGVTLLICLCLAIIIGVAKQKNWLYCLLRKMEFDVLHPTPSSWDYVFSKYATMYLKVTLKDGKTFIGYYSEKSFTSSDIAERDLFLEMKCKEQGGTLYQDESIEGVYIAHGSIRTIEILKRGDFYEQEQSKQHKSKQRKTPNKQRVSTEKGKHGTATAKATKNKRIKQIRKVFTMKKNELELMDNGNIFLPDDSGDYLQHGYQPKATDNIPPPPPLPPTITNTEK